MSVASVAWLTYGLLIPHTPYLQHPLMLASQVQLVFTGLNLCKNWAYYIKYIMLLDAYSQIKCFMLYGELVTSNIRLKHNNYKYKIY